MKESNGVWQPLDEATVASYKAKADGIHEKVVTAREVVKTRETQLEEAKRVLNWLADEYDLWADLWMKAERLAKFGGGKC